MPVQTGTRKGPRQNQSWVPVSLETESAVLGCCLRDRESAEQAVSELSEEDFYSTEHAEIFNAVRTLLETELHPNSVTVGGRVSPASKSLLEGLQVAAMGVGAKELKSLTKELQRVSGLRSIYNSCTNAISSISKTSKVEEITDVLDKTLYKAQKDGSDEAKSGDEVLKRVKSSLLSRLQEGGGVEVSTGLKDLDRAIIGLRPGKMLVLAARPSVGKTAMAGSIRRAVLEQGYGVIDFTLEMDAEELCERELAFQGQVNLRKVLIAKEFTEDETLRVKGLGDNLYGGRWMIEDRAYTITAIKRKAKILAGRMARNGVKLALIVIDYLQLAGDNGEGREQSIATISRGCKMLAKELKCTVLALSQLNRSCEYREDRRPQMSDLRESGSIEQDADVCMFLYREHIYDNSFPPEETELIIRKQRSGPTGTLRGIIYQPKLCNFTDRPPVVNVAPVSGDN